MQCYDTTLRGSGFDSQFKQFFFFVIFIKFFFFFLCENKFWIFFPFLFKGGALERYVVESEREAICAQLNDLENWLYEEGENCDRDTYVAKLKGLHGQTDAIKQRAHNYENCPAAFDELRNSINFARAAVVEFRKGSPKYDHLTEVEFINISETADKAQKWLDQNLAKFAQSPRTADSPVKVDDIRHELQTLHVCVNTVLNRPKPKPAAKPAPPKDAGTEQNGDNTGAEKKDFGTGDVKANTNNVPDDSTMDVE